MQMLFVRYPRRKCLEGVGILVICVLILQLFMKCFEGRKRSITQILPKTDFFLSSIITHPTPDLTGYITEEHRYTLIVQWFLVQEIPCGERSSIFQLMSFLSRLKIWER